MRKIYATLKDKRRAGYLRHREQNLERMRNWRAANSDTVKARNFAQQLKRHYKMTPVDYDHIWNQQEGRCPICRVPLTRGISTHVDHDHATGKVRGLLCGLCNSGLGHFRDDPLRLKNALDYMERVTDRAVVS